MSPVLETSAPRYERCRRARGLAYGWFALSLALVLLSGVLVTAGGAAERGRISGQVRRGDQGIADHRIMLIRFGPDQEVHRTPGQTDPQGRFTFDELETGDTYEYVVGIRSAGQLYRSASVRLRPGEHRTGVVVEVAQEEMQAQEPPPTSVHIAQHLMVVVWRDNRLDIREIVTIRNPGPEPYTGSRQAGGSVLHLPLPQGYSGLTDLQGLEAQHVQFRPSGLDYTAPLAPGDHRVVYTYALPFRSPVTTILVERVLPTRLLDVLIEDSRLVGSSALQFRGRLAIDPHTFWHFRGEDLQPGARAWLQLTRPDGAAPMLRYAAYGLMLGLVLVAIGSASYSAWRRREPSDSAPLPPARVEELHAARLRLLHAVARLDDAYAAGSLAEQDYKRQRQHYKQQLRDLLEPFQRSGHVAESLERT